MAKKPVKTAATPRPEPAPPLDLTVTNCIAGSTLWLSDGRTLAFGESAEVSEEERAFLIERGQAK